MSPSDPATRQDLDNLKGDLLQAMSRMEERSLEAMSSMEERSLEAMSRMEDRFQEAMSSMEERSQKAMSRMEARFERAETTLLQGFHAQMRSQEIRLGRFRADILTIEQELQLRLATVEERITAIEERLPPP